jgi:hypothetical protein
MEQEVNLRNFGFDGGRSGAITTWDREKRRFTIDFPKDYLHFEGLKILAKDGEVITEREAEIRHHLENLRSVAETGELSNG